MTDLGEWFIEFTDDNLATMLVRLDQITSIAINIAEGQSTNAFMRDLVGVTISLTNGGAITDLYVNPDVLDEIRIGPSLYQRRTYTEVGEP